MKKKYLISLFFSSLLICCSCSTNNININLSSVDYWQDVPSQSNSESNIWNNTDEPNVSVKVIGGDKELTDKEQELANEANKNVSLQNMIYNAVIADLKSVGFNAAPGVAFNKDNKEYSVPGIYYYLDDVDMYSSNEIKSCGFIEVVNNNSKQISDFNGDETIFVVDSINNSTDFYVYDYDYENVGPYHFIYQDKYILYTLETDGVVKYIEKENKKENYNLSIGSLYNYDTDTYIYDESIYDDYKSHYGEQLFGSTDYNKLEEDLKKQVEAQKQAGYTVDEYEIVYISPEAIQAYIDSEEEATFFGYNVAELTEEFGLGTALTYTNEGFKPSEIIKPTEDGYNWKSFLIKCGIACGIILVGAILTPVTGGASFGCTLITISKVAVSYALTSAVGALAIETVSGLIQGKGITESIKNATYKGLDSFANGLIIGAAIGSVGVLTGAIKPTACFVAGTQIVQDIYGNYKNIEDIKIGDMVYSYNEYTGESSMEKVVDTFVNKADELIYINVGKDTIISTLNHPFYIPNSKSWLPASKLRVGQELLTANNTIQLVESIEVVSLDNQVNVYNFTVENNHTYYIGDEGILVHNSCDELSKKEINSTRSKAGRTAKKQALEDIENLRNPATGKIRAADLREWATKYGLDMTNPNDVKVANFVAKNGRFPSYSAGDGFQCDFAHAIDVNKIVKAYNQGYISKDAALSFISNSNNGILTSRQTHYFLHGGSWSGTTNFEIALKARPSIDSVVKSILTLVPIG